MNKEESLLELLEKDDGTDRIIGDLLTFVESSRNIVVFGAGVGGTVLYELLQREGKESKIIFYTDNNSLKHGTYFCEKRVIVPEQLVDYIDEVNVVIASSAYSEIKEQLVHYGFAHDKIMLFNHAFSDFEYTDKQYIYEHIDDFQWIYRRLSDKKSKQIFMDLLNYKISKKNIYLEDMKKYSDSESEQYFDQDIIKLNVDESFVDVGSYTGDTLKQFIRVSKNQFAAYYGFEADTDTFNILKEYSDTLRLNTVKVYNLGAWDKRTCLSVVNDKGSYGSFSFVECLNGEGVEADALDHILDSREVSFIKMDIEGAEYYALKGLQGIIKRCLPKLAICVYHKRNDYFSIPQLIDEIARDKYEFYFRQYRYTPTETVCYAIPKNEHSVKKFYT